ncbi:MAG: LCP family protein [Ruminococcus sp.]|nr:LCP family protein [Ruminococcus sp.]
MSLQDREGNHNNNPLAKEESNPFLDFQKSDFEKITGLKPEQVAKSDNSESSDEERAHKLQEAIEQENSSAYEDLDDFVYRQNKKRARTSGKRHHHRHRSPSKLSPGHKGSKIKKNHKHKHHFHKHHRSRMKRWQKIILGIIAGLLALIIAALAVLIIMINSGKNSLLDREGLNINAPKNARTVDNGEYIVYKGNKYKYNDNITSILCMGVDKNTLNNVDGDVGTGGDADSIFIIAMDLSNGKSKLINISRDTMTEIGIYSPNGSYIGEKKAQLALAYAYGNGRETSCHNEVVAVRQLLYNIPINSYLSLDMQGIGAINDAMGGITVVSPETISEFKKGKTYTLMGSMAQSYVRSRSHATIQGNSLRMERQKSYIESFSSSLFNKTKSDLMTPLNIYNVASPYVCTNIDANKVSYFSYTAVRGGYNGFEIKTVPGKTKAGKKYAEFYVDEDKCFEMFLDVYYTKVGKAE